MRQVAPFLSIAALTVAAVAQGCSSGSTELPYQDAGAGASSSGGGGSDASSGGQGDSASESGADGGSGSDASKADGATPDGAGLDAVAADGPGPTDAPAGVDAPPNFDGGTTGEAWVLRVGAAGSASAPTNLAAAVFLNRFVVADGSVHGSIALPVAGSGANQPLTVSGSATSEGALNVTGDGKYVLLAGYAAAPGAADNHADGAISGIKDSPTTGTGAVLRVIGRVDSAGTVDTSFTTTAFSANNIRGAASPDGTAYWMFGDGSGSTDGISYQATSGGVATFVSTGVATVRIASVFGGRVYGASATGAIRGVFSMTDPLPTVAETGAVLPGFPTTLGPSPYAFVALALGGTADLDTIYLCDDRSSATGGGLERWNLASGTWTLATTLNDSMTSGCRGVTGSFDGTNVTLLVTTTETTGNHLLKFVDTAAGLATITATKLADAPANTVFRGVALAPN